MRLTKTQSHDPQKNTLTMISKFFIKKKGIFPKLQGNRSQSSKLWKKNKKHTINNR